MLMVNLITYYNKLNIKLKCIFNQQIIIIVINGIYNKYHTQSQVHIGLPTLEFFTYYKNNILANDFFLTNINDNNEIN